MLRRSDHLRPRTSGGTKSSHLADRWVAVLPSGRHLLRNLIATQLHVSSLPSTLTLEEAAGMAPPQDGSLAGYGRGSEPSEVLRCTICGAEAIDITAEDRQRIDEGLVPRWCPKAWQHRRKDHRGKAPMELVRLEQAPEG
jgi:hypothetical protein